jgi:hypothetical protein
MATATARSRSLQRRVRRHGHSSLRQQIVKHISVARTARTAIAGISGRTGITRIAGVANVAKIPHVLIDYHVIVKLAHVGA